MRFCGSINLDTLRLHWQRSAWEGPDSVRNNPGNTVRYEWNAIIDSLGVNSKTITIAFKSSNDGLSPGIRLSGAQAYLALFRPPVWPVLEPDTLVMRVRWFVRAHNSVGSTYSDTAGVTIRDNPTPTPALVLSYNRPPLHPPLAIEPVDNSVKGGLDAASPPVLFIWTAARDRNIDAGIRMECFRDYDIRRGGWYNVVNRTVDTLFYQWIGKVVRTVPAGKGAPVGEVIVRNAGASSGIQLDAATLSGLLGGFDSSTGTSADTVVLDWMVYVKDFNYNDELPSREVTFRYNANGTLRPDTSAWSRFGCQPHEAAGPLYRVTLAKRSTVGVRYTDESAPLNAELISINPNPFNSITTIHYRTNKAGNVKLEVYDILGAKIATLAENVHNSGNISINWNGADSYGRSVPPGVYVCRLIWPGGARSRLMHLLR